MNKNKMLDRLSNIDSMFQEVQDLRNVLKKTMRAEQEDYAKRGLDWSTSNEDFESDKIREKLIDIVNNWYEDIHEIVSFIRENKEEIIEVYNRKHEKEDPEDQLDEETEARLQFILSDERLAEKFFNETFPANLMKEFNISREEYDEILKQADMNADKEEIIESIIDRITNKNELEFKPFYSISQQLEDKQNENSIYTTSKWF